MAIAACAAFTGAYLDADKASEAALAILATCASIEDAGEVDEPCVLCVRHALNSYGAHASTAESSPGAWAESEVVGKALEWVCRLFRGDADFARRASVAIEACVRLVAVGCEQDALLCRMLYANSGDLAASSKEELDALTSVDARKGLAAAPGLPIGARIVHMACWAYGEKLYSLAAVLLQLLSSLTAGSDLKSTVALLVHPLEIARAASAGDEAAAEWFGTLREWGVAAGEEDATTGTLTLPLDASAYAGTECGMLPLDAERVDQTCPFMALVDYIAHAHMEAMEEEDGRRSLVDRGESDAAWCLFDAFSTTLHPAHRDHLARYIVTHQVQTPEDGGVPAAVVLMSAADVSPHTPVRQFVMSALAEASFYLPYTMFALRNTKASGVLGRVFTRYTEQGKTLNQAMAFMANLAAAGSGTTVEEALENPEAMKDLAEDVDHEQLVADLSSPALINAIATEAASARYSSGAFASLLWTASLALAARGEGGQTKLEQVFLTGGVSKAVFLASFEGIKGTSRTCAMIINCVVNSLVREESRTAIAQALESVEVNEDEIQFASDEDRAFIMKMLS